MCWIFLLQPIDTSPAKPPEVNETEEENVPLGRLLEILHQYNKLEKKEEEAAKESAGYRDQESGPGYQPNYDRAPSYGYRRNNDDYSGGDNNYVPPTSGYNGPRKPNIYSEESYSFNRPGYAGTSPEPSFGNSYN